MSRPDLVNFHVNRTICLRRETNPPSSGQFNQAQVLTRWPQVPQLTFFPGTRIRIYHGINAASNWKPVFRV